MYEVAILRSRRRDNAWEYQGWCKGCHRHVTGKRGDGVAASKGTIQTWAREHLADHQAAEDYVERMAAYRYEVCGTVKSRPRRRRTWPEEEK